MRSIAILVPDEGESCSAFLRRLRALPGDVLVVVSGQDDLGLSDDKHLQKFLAFLTKESGRVRLAVRYRGLAQAARSRGVRVIDRLPDLRTLLEGHPKLDEAVRVFHPHVWRQQLRSQLQLMGLLSLPRLRIWILTVVSVGLFVFVVFRLLPSAEIRVAPHSEPISQTSNILLVLSGATVDTSQQVRTMELQKITVELSRSMTFDQISKQFIGQSAQVPMTVINASKERFTIRAESRLGNQAGMVFRIQEPVILDPGQEVTVMAKADDVDLYGEIIGQRGNLPAGVRWNFLGLTAEQQRVVYAENRAESSGGTTDYRTVLQEGDLKIARARLEEDLLAQASQLVDEEITLRNQASDGRQTFRRLYYKELTKMSYTGFVMPTEFIGTKVTSVPIQGGIVYTAYAYDAQYALQLLRDELVTHVGENSELIESSISLDRLEHAVIAYEDDFSTMKLTMELVGTERSILDPLSPAGATFHKKVRELVAGKSHEDAIRIIKNLPEVEGVSISLWPPWSDHLPGIPYHISIVAETEG